jgi:hypothetical protein
MNDWRPISSAPFGVRVLIGYNDDHPLGWHVQIGTLRIAQGVEPEPYWDEPYWDVCDGEDGHDPDPKGSKYTPRWWMPLPRTPDAT